MSYYDEYQAALRQAGGFEPEADFLAQAAAMGYEVEDPRHAQLRAELDRLKAQVAHQQQTDQQAADLAQQAEREQHVDALADETEARMDQLGIPEEQRDALIRHAVTMELAPDGLPDIHKAALELNAYGQSEQQHQSAQQLDEWATRSERVAWMDNRLREDQRAEVDLQRQEVAAGALDAKQADELPVWERENREPNLDDQEERHAYMAEQLRERGWED